MDNEDLKYIRDKVDTLFTQLTLARIEIAELRTQSKHQSRLWGTLSGALSAITIMTIGILVRKAI